VAEDQRLSFAPILVIDLGAIFGRDRRNVSFLKEPDVTTGEIVSDKPQRPYAARSPVVSSAAAGK
jgi:hypothetical protein